ncbi:MAG: sigma-70 family RNA polymerase sigma factor [Akkermansiaceae bacterium]|nr:sigma-70 family RNA polymerase sigma factor [Akkermansiaceae bacterium]MDP4898750.1 sigma-70 family RNA polymerase sigma factor [Akkermansiaceae bacterium]
MKARKGDLDAFTELVKRYQGSVRACLVVRLPDVHEAEDLAQEAFIIAYRKLDEFDVERAFGPWIRTIAVNLLRNYWRKHKATLVGGSAELEILVDEEIALNHSIENESDRLEALKHCMAKLDAPMRTLVTLRYYEHYSIAQLRKAMNVNHSTVTMRLHRLREILQKCIQQQMGVIEG